MGMFSPETERLRQLLAEQMTHTTGQSGGIDWGRQKERMGLIPRSLGYTTIGGEPVGDSFTGMLTKMVDAMGTDQFEIAGRSIDPLDFVNPVAGIFGGKLAKTADLMALREAMNRATAGDDARKIWQETGWFKSPDGQWRFEIDDSASTLRRDLAENQLTPVDSAFTHPTLYKAYPSVTDIDVFPHSGSGGALGSYGDDMINLRVGMDPRLAATYGDSSNAANKSTMLHELQHAIQQREGFARGGSPEMFKVQPSQVNALRMTYDALRDGQTVSDYLWEKGIRQTSDAGFHEALQEAAKKLGMPYDTAADGLLAQLNGRTYLARPSATQGFVDRARKEYERAAKESVMGFDAMEKYRLLAGEAEARAVQARMNLTPEQRRMRFPLDDYDVPVDELIMRYGDGPAMSVDNIQQQIRDKHGLKTFFLSERDPSTLTLNMIEVDKTARGQGKGTAAMRDLVDYADSQGKRIYLNPGLADDLHGTTSRNRLVKFYKRFGFVENKGRNKDFTLMGGMYRDPK